MANFDLSYDRLLKLEFSNPKNALHKNVGESGYTFMGIYETAHPDWGGWDIVRTYLRQNKCLERVSIECCRDRNLRDLVEYFYKENFWDKMKLDNVFPFRIADLMFKFGVNVGIKRAVRFAQEVVGVKTDGIVGKQTLKALNSHNPIKFESEYKAKFIKFYKRLASRHPQKYGHFLNGWIDRTKVSQINLVNIKQNNFIHS